MLHCFRALLVLLGGGDDNRYQMVPTIHVKESLREFEEPRMWCGKASRFQEQDFMILKPDTQGAGESAMRRVWMRMLALV
jgi:hypothetical protein